jgi:dihydrolipoamide dehydrogenase
VEFASIFRSFGADVTVLEALPRLLPTEDAAVSAALQRAYRRRGITVRTGVRVAGVVEDADGVRVQVEGAEPLEADLLLVAVGRGPASADVGLDEAGVTLDAGGFVETDERCRTSVPGVRAVGDLVRGLQLAHRGFAQGIFVAEDLAGLDPAPVDEATVPRVTYSDPEVVSVGLTEEQARERFGEVATTQYGLGGNGRSLILGTTGFVKLVRRVDGPVVGVHMVGARMGEQAGEAQLLVGWEAFPEDVAPLLHAHPTQNEALGEASLALAGKPLHAHD